MKSPNHWTSKMNTGLNLSIAAGLAFAMSACGAATDAAYAITFRAESDPGVPLEGVAFTVNGVEIPDKTTNAGSIQALVHGKPDMRVQAQATCPSGYSLADSLPSFALSRVPLTSLQAQGNNANAGFEVVAHCTPIKRRAVLVVRAVPAPNAAGTLPLGNLPVRVDGREVARTDRSGVAHVELEAEPNHTFTVEIRTDSVPLLRPANRSHLKPMPDSDDYINLTQVFAMEAQPVAAPVAAPTPTRRPAVRRPARPAEAPAAAPAAPQRRIPTAI